MSRIFRSALTAVLLCSAALAQNNRSAVSVNGSDANPCTTIAPCRSFTAALAHTNAGGEVIAFDSGGYGSFTIGKSVSVIGAPGIHAALTVTSGNGIEVAAGASDTVVIRNLNITVSNSTATGGNAIHATSFKTLNIVNCHVSGGYDAIVINGASGSQTMIVDTAVRGAGNVGFYLDSDTTLVRCRAERCPNCGLYVQNGAASSALVSAVDLVAANNGVGVAVYSTGASELNLDRALICNSALDGITVFDDPDMPGTYGKLYITNSTVTNNGRFGLSQTWASVVGSMKNNMIVDNGQDINGQIDTLTAY
jgi:hypothetical protein